MPIDAEKVNEKLDKLLEYAYRHDEKLAELNGSVKENQKELNACENRIDWNSQKIWLAMGGLGVFSLLAATKMIGLW